MGKRRKKGKRKHVVVEVGKNYEPIHKLENIWHSHTFTKVRCLHLSMQVDFRLKLR
jgi:hypothetical protein